MNRNIVLLGIFVILVGMSGCISTTGEAARICGDGVCSPGENVNKCPLDCGSSEPPSGDTQCSDGVDNDGDGLIDYKVNPKGKVIGDPDCSSSSDDSEATLYCGDGSCNNGETCSSCEADCGACDTCGDGIVSGTEECDDGNQISGDGCSSTCTVEIVCGDGICDVVESCDSCISDCGMCNSCYDSDGGYVPALRGDVHGYNDGQWYNMSDFCESSGTLVEYYCTPRFDGEIIPMDSIVPCFNVSMNSSCVNGRCI